MSMEALYKRKLSPSVRAGGDQQQGKVFDDIQSKPSKKSQKQILAEKVLEIATRESVHKSFGRTLLEESFVDYEINHQAKSIAYKIKVPASLCFDSSSSAAPNHICVSAMLALFDELSTMALFVFDQTRRPGVSVDLKTEILHPIHEGELVYVHTIIEKTGKILAFCALEVYNEVGQLVARGSHVKFMPMGWIWDFLAGSLLLNFTMILYQLFRGSKMKTPLDAFFRAKRSNSDISGSFNASGKEVAAVYRSLAVTPYNPEDEQEKLLQEAERDGLKGVFQVIVRRDLMNPVSSMHGGAVACSIEEACRQYLQRRYASDAEKLMISELTIQYQAPLKAQVLILVEEDEHSSYLVQSQTGGVRSGILGRCVDKKNGKKSVEFSCQVKFK